MPPISPETLHIMTACRNHAKDLYRAAEKLQEEGLANVAYHLATLALEELGKAQLVGMRSMANDEGVSWHEKQLDDHVKKLFWALWGPTLTDRRPEQQEIESLRNLAVTIHENRLRGLYVSADPTDFVIPREAIGAESLAPLMKLVEAHIGMTPDPKSPAYSDENLALLQWFENATDDTEKRKFIFSSASFDKMEELANPREWIKWLKTELETREREGMALLNKELQRVEPQDTEAGKEKWQVKVRLFSQSHSIRPKALNQWNDRVTWIKLHPVDKKKDQFLAEFKLPKAIPIQALWFAAFGYANTLVAAFNIATFGFFWWYMPEHISRFYESIVDVENKTRIGVERSPQLKIGWPNATLDSSILNRIVFCFAMMPRPDDRAHHEPFNHYLTGLGYIANTDVFQQFETLAYGAFVSALETGTLAYSDRSMDQGFEEIFTQLARELINNDDLRTKHSDLIQAYRLRAVSPGSITLSEVAEMKLMCDAYFFRAFNKLADRGRNDTKKA
jgi:AbiV family abortive infection protein